MNDRYTFCTLVSGRTATNWAISDWTSSKSSSIASILSSRFHFMEQNLTTLDLLLLTDKMVPSLHFWMRERSAPEAVLFSSLIFLMRLNLQLVSFSQRCLQVSKQFQLQFFNLFYIFFAVGNTLAVVSKAVRFGNCEAFETPLAI